jgi:eukaryotic-like serine/threonine-protein kinase
MSLPAGARFRFAARNISAAGASLRADQASRGTVLGEWRLTRIISRSGALAVYRARPIRDARGPGCYVIKAIAGGASDDQLALALLRREATVAERAVNPHLAAVLANRLKDKRPHLTLPYLEGVSLRRLLARPSRESPHLALLLPIPFALCISRQVALALAALHESGWLHGQVRPEHVVISPPGHATLIDLTLARRLGSPECETDGMPCNAPRYSPPESFVPCARLTAASDIYSLGIMLFESLTGQPPFTAPDPRRLAMCHRRERPPELRQICPHLSRETSALMWRMLAKEPLRRPTAREVVRWLAEIEIEELSSTTQNCTLSRR